MKRPTCPQAVMLITAVIGITLVALWQLSSTSPPASEGDKLKFAYAGSARVMRPGGRYMDVTVYKFPDNREVSWIWEPNLPSGVAELELQEFLKGDVEVTERTPVLSEQGEAVGERVVALFHINGRGHVPHVFLWKNYGGSIYRIEGTSLDQVLAVERTLK